MADEFELAGKKFEELLRIMARLRAPGGCPWDRKQTFDTIKTYLLEESYEVMDAIDSQDWTAVSEELGDLLLQPVFFAEMAREEGLFHIGDCLDAIVQKLIRRHPHVFGDASAKTAEDVKARWDEIKKEEKAERGISSTGSILDDIPRSLPALVEADKIGHKVGKKGFEWPDVNGVVDKIQEEAAELAAARDTSQPAEIEHEIGDLLFNLVNLARYLKVDPEQALRKTNSRFRKRFAHIEAKLAVSGVRMEDTPLENLEELWQEAKRTQ
jgi:MazG family protein